MRDDSLSPPKRTIIIENKFETARNIEHKYEFFFTGLIFAIVGLAVQTAETWISGVIIVLEIGGWFLFLIAGISSLLRVDRIVVIHKRYAMANEYQDRVKKEFMDEYENKTKKINAFNAILYYIRGITFVLAILMIAISRGCIIVFG